MLNCLSTLLFLLIYRTHKIGGFITGKMAKYIFFISRILRGRAGRFLSRLPFADISLLIGGEIKGEWLVEEKSSVLDYSSTRAVFSFTWKRKWDIFLPPAGLTCIMFLVLDFIYDFEIEVVDGVPQTGGLIFGIAYFLSFFVPVILILFYIPLIWTLSDGEIKRYIYDTETKEITKVENVGESIRRLFNNIFGWGALLSIATFAVETDRLLREEQGQGTAKIDFLEVFVMAIIYFIVLALLVGPSMLILTHFYIKWFHEALIKYMRVGLVNEGVKYGTVQIADRPVDIVTEVMEKDM